jgi:hypothetical protein
LLCTYPFPNSYYFSLSPSVSCIPSFIAFHYYCSYFPFPLLHQFRHIFVPFILYTLFLSLFSLAVFLIYFCICTSFSSPFPPYTLPNSLFTFSPPFVLPLFSLLPLSCLFWLFVLIRYFYPLLVFVSFCSISVAQLV